MKFEIVFSPESLEHLQSLRGHDRALILKTVESQLGGQPLTPTRNRKPMRSNLIATWELRIGNFRVYYDVDDAQRTVLVHAIGIKLRNRVLIGGEEIDLS